MARRGVLLSVAAVVAALGTLLVFMYVRSADARVASEYDSVDVLVATKVITPGESVDSAAAAGKFQLKPVPRNQRLAGVLTDTNSLVGKVATTSIYPGEQIIASKFGGAAESSVLPIPQNLMAISVNLTDPARVAGFVSPGSEVAIFMTTEGLSRLLLPRVQVIGVGSTAPGTTTTKAGDGTSTTEQLHNGEVAFGLLTKESEVPKGHGITFQNLFQ
jgi:pilus assembly protein CpaB